MMVDPWLLGSCYWRSWWNYPPAPGFVTRMESLDYIYLTHMHWDHFHGPSLRKLPSGATLLIPEAHFERMRKDAEIFKFREIIELPHGKAVELKDGMRVTSYQYGLFMDTTLAVEDRDTCLVNMNDCKLRGRALKQLIDRTPRVDFLFRSHSSASAYPNCVTPEDPDDVVYRTREDYMNEFVDTTRLLEARYAIPFASSHCYLHKETVQYNDIAVTPKDVYEQFQQNPPPNSECVVMLAGDSWSVEDGFQIRESDYFTRRDERVAEYAAEKAPILDAYYELESGVDVSFRPFKKYFQAQIDSLPRVLRLLFKPVIVFGLPGRDDIHWIVDFDKRDVYELDTLPESYSCRVVIPPIVLKDCLYKHMFATFSASKRVSIEIRKGGLRDYLIFFQLLDMFEYEYFPLRMLVKPRFLRVWLRRWREVLDYAGLLLAVVFARKGEDPLKKFVAKIDEEPASNS